MNGFERVTIDAFDAAIAASPSSEAFKKQVARFSLGLDDPCLVHRGPLTVAGHFRRPDIARSWSAISPSTDWSI
jgi:hypothetical protein